MARNTRETVYGMITGATWHTGVNLAALTGILPASVDKWALTTETFVDESIGFAEVENIDLIKHVADPVTTFHGRRSGAQWQVWAAVFGDDTISGVGPFVHTFNWQVEPAFFYTMAKEVNNTDIAEWPSLKFTGLTFEHDGNGMMSLVGRTIGDTIVFDTDAQNTGTEFDLVTYITKALLIPFRELRFRINAQGGAGLGSGDVVKLSNLSLTIDRSYERDDLTQGVNTGAERQTDEPQQAGGLPNIGLTIEVNDYTSIALLQQLQNETELKADLFWDRTIGGTAYQITIELGDLYPMEQTIAADEGGNRYSLTRTFRGMKPASIPTGMRTANPVDLVLQDNHNTTFE